MAKIRVNAQVQYRDRFGRFISECEAAKYRMLERVGDVGERVAKAEVPRGSKPDPRTRTLLSSIKTRQSGNTVIVEAIARHALHQEYGTGPHVIRGNPKLKFYWENRGVNFVGPLVNHPGHGPQPYLRPAYAAMAARVMDIARQEYPG